MKKALLALFVIFISLIEMPLSAVAPRQTMAATHETKKVHLFVLGTGVVGGMLLDQIEMNSASLAKRFGVDIHVVGIANSRALCVNRRGIDMKNWRLELAESDAAVKWQACLDLLTHANLKNLVFVDCTSDQSVADTYAAILRAGVSIVTPNKKAASSRLATYDSLIEAAQSKGVKFIYDANVGAGLPVLSTIRSLVRSGDEIVKVEAVLSGTLSYLFNTFGEGAYFSRIVQSAQEKGYTEPDPRDDLNGMDFARKLLILSRVAGYMTEKEQIQVQRFLPDDCFSAPSVDDFYEKLQSYDGALMTMQKNAAAEGKRLRYIGSFENGKGQISLQAVGPEHPFYGLSGTDNIIAIWTKYYSKNPIVIRGPGAGADVTAARVLEGIVRVGLE